jgi:transcriptional regulator GlxA family with amidase domain
MKTLVALAADGCMASCPRAFTDMAAYADRALGGAKLRGVLATKGGKPVNAFGGSVIEAEFALEDFDGPSAPPSRPGRKVADCLCLPVPLGPLETLYADRELGAEVLRLHREGCLVAAPCASVFLLAEAGLLAGRRVPITPRLAERFSRLYPEVEIDGSSLLRDEQDIIVSVGAASVPELGVLAIRRLCGREAAEAAAGVFLDKDGAGRLASLDFDDECFKAARFIEERYAERLVLADLAEAACLEERTFVRRFARRYGMSPTDYLRLARCKAAAELLGSSGLRVAEIGWRVGYAESASFGRAFKAVFGISPTEARNGVRH